MQMGIRMLAGWVLSLVPGGVPAKQMVMVMAGRPAKGGHRLIGRLRGSLGGRHWFRKSWRGRGWFALRKLKFTARFR